MVELTHQLRGETDDNQIKGARIGMAQNIGGSGATVVTHFMRKNEDPLPHSLDNFSTGRKSKLTLIIPLAN